MSDNITWADLERASQTLKNYNVLPEGKWYMILHQDAYEFYAALYRRWERRRDAYLRRYRRRGEQMRKGKR